MGRQQEGPAFTPRSDLYLTAEGATTSNFNGRYKCRPKMRAAAVAIPFGGGLSGHRAVHGPVGNSSKPPVVNQ